MRMNYYFLVMRVDYFRDVRLYESETECDRSIETLV